MRLLITGGTGYLGSELAVQARGAGWQVEAPGSRQLDVRDERALDRALAQLRPDALVNCAYRQDTPDTWQVNAEGAGVVARAAAACGVRLVHVATDVVFDGARGSYREDDATSPINEYGRSKEAGERAVADAYADALIARTSLIYGGRTPSKHEVAARESRFTFFVDELRCPTQVGDLGAALLELIPLDLSGLLHVAGADAVSRCDFARLVAGDGVRCGTSRAAGVVRPLDCTLDSSRARSLLRTRLRGVREVLAE